MEKLFVCMFTDYLFQNPYALSVFCIEATRGQKKTKKKTKVSQKPLGNGSWSRTARARPLARTNETKRFPGWGRCALTPQPPT